MNPIHRTVLYTLTISWAVAGLFYFLGVRPGGPLFFPFSLLYMWIPGLIALGLARRGGLNLLRWSRPSRYWLLAWLLPVVLTLLSVPVSLLFGPWVGLEGFLRQLPSRLPLETLPPTATLLLLIILQALVAGATLNLLAALGEELMWRGYLWEQVRGLGLWRAAWLIGGVWGVWHTPLILQGYNYPQHPLLGVLWMTLFTLLLSPWMLYLRERGGSVWVAALFHGTLNAVGPLGHVLVERTSDLLVGMLGLAGFVVLLAANLVLYALCQPGESWVRR